MLNDITASTKYISLKILTKLIKYVENSPFPIFQQYKIYCNSGTTVSISKQFPFQLVFKAYTNFINDNIHFTLNNFFFNV